MKKNNVIEKKTTSTRTCIYMYTFIHSEVKITGTFSLADCEKNINTKCSFSMVFFPIVLC